MPKTVDNDVHPIKQTLGAMTAAMESARFFRNVVNESSASPRMLVIHEVRFFWRGGGGGRTLARVGQVL